MANRIDRMTASLESVAGGHSIYVARRQEFATGRRVPFRVAPAPFQLTSEQEGEISTIGADITSYFKAVDELYRSDGTVRNILNTGKPEIFVVDRPAQYLFVRPDLIITPKGFSVCEIETSPFGLALAEMLNRAYRQEGFETMVDDGTLPGYVQAHTPIEGTIVYSNKTVAYTGQLTFLADEVFSGQGREWKTQKVEDALTGEKIDGKGIYRGIYLGEYMTDPAVKMLLDRSVDYSDGLLPSPTPHMEEKAVLAFLWDSRFEQRLRKQLGDAAFNHLRAIIPPTWIVGQEQFFVLGMPDGVSTSVDLASLSRSKRTLVLKESGFGVRSSWGEGVKFLHDQSANTARALLQQAHGLTDSLFVVQQFNKAQDIPMTYESQDGIIQTAPRARVRLTPYFSMSEGNAGRLVGIKATGCENTDFIHSSSASINAAVR
jgi:hypothetical protein